MVNPGGLLQLLLQGRFRDAEQTVKDEEMAMKKRKCQWTSSH